MSVNETESILIHISIDYRKKQIHPSIHLTNYFHPSYAYLFIRIDLSRFMYSTLTIATD
jgi:hypothetical protein